MKVLRQCGRARLSKYLQKEGSDMSKEEIRIGTAIARPGERVYGALKVAELNDSSPIEIPVAIVRGQEDGPVVWVQNGVHGDEYVGLGAIQWMLRDLDPRAMRGSVIALPVVNILAYRARSRGAPQDGLDMNRVYPGKPLATAMHVFAHSELVVHKLLAYLLEYSDVVVDCHDGFSHTALAPYVAYSTGPAEQEEQSRRLAIQSGMAVVWKNVGDFVDEKYPGSLWPHLAKAGIPNIMLEAGGQGRLDKKDITWEHRALLNTLRHLEMIEGKVEIPQPQIFMTNGHWMRPEAGGAFWAHVEPLQRVKRGDPFGTITDLFGRERERLVAPVDGVIIGIRTHGTVHSGEYCGNVGEPD